MAPNYLQVWCALVLLLNQQLAWYMSSWYVVYEQNQSSTSGRWHILIIRFVHTLTCQQ